MALAVTITVLAPKPTSTSWPKAASTSELKTTNRGRHCQQDKIKNNSLSAARRDKARVQRPALTSPRLANTTQPWPTQSWPAVNRRLTTTLPHSPTLHHHHQVAGAKVASPVHRRPGTPLSSAPCANLSLSIFSRYFPPLDDMDRTVVILGSFVGVDILSLSENSRYEFHPPSDDDAWKGGQTQDPTPPFLSLAVGEHLFDPLGWVIGSGSDPDKCDLQISDTNQTGISRRHLRLDIHPVTHCPRITVLSTKSVKVLMDDTDALTCLPHEPRQLFRPATLGLGAVTFRAWTPSRTYAQTTAYEKWAGEFSSGLLGAVPRYIPSIEDYPETGEYDVRFGSDGAVYVDGRRHESKGASASVMLVKEMRSGKFFGAKVPHFNIHDSHDVARKRWEDLGMEYKYILELDHVRTIFNLPSNRC